MANVLTAIRLLLVLPVALAFARPAFLPPFVLAVLIAMAIATDYYDGRIARATGTASPRGMLFDHTTDCLFVTAGLAGIAMSGGITRWLPVLVPIAFTQYVVDSYVWHRQRQLRASSLGRWNGILYFAPIVIVAGSRLPLFPGFFVTFLQFAAQALAYLLVLSTLVSIVDRATTPVRTPVKN